MFSVIISNETSVNDKEIEQAEHTTQYFMRKSYLAVTVVERNTFVNKFTLNNTLVKQIGALTSTFSRITNFPT